MMSIITNLKSIYMCFFKWLLPCSKRIDKLHQYKVHTLISITFFTGILMWGYAFTAYNYIDHDSIKYTGFIYAIVHLSTLLCYKATGSLEKSIYVMLIPGGLFQVHFSILSGGFLNPILMWIAILPVIAGALTGRKHTLIWIALIISTASTICILDLCFGYFHVDHLDHSGLIATQALTVFGMIILHSGLVMTLLKIRNISEEQLRNKAISKQNLLRILAHDVSTPLTLIQNNTLFLEKLLSKNKIDDIDKKKFENKVVSTNKYSQKICNVIKAVRELEAFESGKKAIHLEKISLRECINDSIEMLGPLISKKRITIHSTLEDINILGIKSIVEHQILSNIISNSIKFSEEDSEIQIYTELSKEHVSVFIKDRGIGIPKNILRRLFDPLIMTSRQGTNGEEGTGFGMPIAKRCIDLLDGEISVESRLHKGSPGQQGTCFKITFKLYTENSFDKVS